MFIVFRRLARALCALSCLILFAAAVPAQAQDATLARAKQLIDSKQPQAAFDLLDPLESTRAGDPDYDYLLGLSALDSGKFTRAVFAFERVLAVRPDHPQARAEIARAYFMLGENRVAREEFEKVKSANPPGEVVATVNQYLDALQSREKVAGGTGITAYLEVGGGYDTNANAATGVGSFALPAFGGAVVTLGNGAAATHDWFYSIGGGVSGRYKFNDTWSLIGSGSTSWRWNSKLDTADTMFLAGDGGVVWNRGDHEVTALLQTQESRVDYGVFRRANGGTAQYRYNLGADSQIAVYGQHARLIYPGQRQRDTIREVGGVAYATALRGSLSPSVYVSLYGGSETETNTGFGNFGHRVTGLRLGGQLTVTPKLIAFASGSYEDRRYRGPDPFFLDVRHDRQADVRVGANYAVYGNFTVTPSVSWTDNRSNLILYDYSRIITMVTLRYDFR